jgi:ABC-type multidrug transport system ATPase subunit
MNPDRATSLNVQNVSFSFSKKAILHDLNLTISSGEVFALIGHNGAGKTTLFHLILGYKFANRGDIQIFGKNAFQSHARKEIGYVPERAYLPVEQTFFSYLKYLANLQGLPQSGVKGEVERVAKEVGLQDVIHQPMKSFSKGMLQKTMLAQAILGNPRLIILDEPMSGLDPEARDQLRARIQTWQTQGKTVLFSTHAMEDVEQLADRVMVLDKGAMTFLGTTPEWMTQAKRGQS